MALDINLTTDVEVTAPQTIQTTNTRVKGVYFNFDDTEATAIVAFGDIVDTEFIEKKQENWRLSGDYYAQTISELTSGKSIAEELLTKVATIISTINTDTALKAQLLESGELKIE